MIFKFKIVGVRSLNFRNNLLSIGTGIGTVMFYDIRANKFLCKDTDKNTENQNHLSLQTRGGWIVCYRNKFFFNFSQVLVYIFKLSI